MTPMHYEASVIAGTPAAATPAVDEKLRGYIERVERLLEEVKGIQDDIRDVYLESKSQGYDPKIMRQIVRLRKMQPHDRKEMEAILDVYKNNLGIE